MDVTITRESPILIKADVNVPWDRVSPHYQEALKTISSTVQIPGFRKGKAPAALLKKRFRDHILGDVAQKVIPETLEIWLKENDIRAVGTPKLSHMDLKAKQSFSYIAEIDVLPTIELKEWRDLHAEQLNAKVTAEMVDDELERRRQAATQKETITDRGIEDGDRVTLALNAVDAESGDMLS